MLLAILRATPVFVWLLLVALVALGASQLRPRTLSPLRVALLPAAMLALSAFAVSAGFAIGPAALACWTGGVAVALAAGRYLLPPAQASWSAPTGRFAVAGSWPPMSLILILFALKYAAGVSVGMHPELAARASFAAPFSLAYGLFSGIFAARAWQLLQLRRAARA